MRTLAETRKQSTGARFCFHFKKQERQVCKGGISVPREDLIFISTKGKRRDTFLLSPYPHDPEILSSVRNAFALIRPFGLKAV